MTNFNGNLTALVEESLNLNVSTSFGDAATSALTVMAIYGEEPCNRPYCHISLITST